MPGCPLDSQWQALAESFVLGPGMEENSFSLEQFKNYVENIHNPSVCTESGWEV